MSSLTPSRIAITVLSRYWSLLVLVLILAFFEVYAQVETGGTFIFRAYNLRSIGVAASQILLLSLGLTLVIVAGRIDLSIAFSTGLAAVAMAIAVRWGDAFLAPPVSFGLGLVVGLVAAA
ncbi:MAG TPA: ribose ABC transporter, partial [Gammaproteobacteria bacterium]|nr:ribose ABC transporter [Gammaproteobacteria bacterium]